VPRVLADLSPISAIDLRQTSAARGDLVIGMFTLDSGQRSFCVAAARTWNELLDWLHNVETVNTSKTALKHGSEKLAY